MGSSALFRLTTFNPAALVTEDAPGYNHKTQQRLHNFLLSCAGSAASASEREQGKRHLLYETIAGILIELQPTPNPNALLTALRLSIFGNAAHLIAFHAWDNLFVFWDL